MKQALDGKRLLVIDDDPVFNMALSSYLRLLGATVLSAGDGARAWACIEEGFQPELIFCDLNMPVMTGAEFIARLQSELPAVPVIVISATQKCPILMKCCARGKGCFVKAAEQAGRSKKLCLSHLYPSFSHRACWKTMICPGSGLSCNIMWMMFYVY